MKILIVAATEFEIAESIPFLQKYQVDYLITGVGMTATAFALGQRLAKKSYDLLVNVGIAGTFDPSRSLGDLVRVTTDQIFQFGAEDKGNFVSIETLGFGQSGFTAVLPETQLPPVYTQLDAVEGISVNKVHGSEQSIKELNQTLSPQTIESMEGAAFFYCATQANLPAIQVRSISNFVEPRNTKNWNIPDALSKLNHWVREFILQHRS